MFIKICFKSEFISGFGLPIAPYFVLSSAFFAVVVFLGAAFSAAVFGAAAFLAAGFFAAPFWGAAFAGDGAFIAALVTAGFLTLAMSVSVRGKALEITRASRPSPPARSVCLRGDSGEILSRQLPDSRGARLHGNAVAGPFVRSSWSSRRVTLWRS